MLTLSGNGPASWSFQARIAEGSAVQVELMATLKEGWHVYATELPSDLGPLPTVFRFSDSPHYKATGPVQEPLPVEVYDENFAMVVRHHSGTPVFTLPVERLTDDPFTVDGELEYMVCNDKTCLPPEVVKFRIEVPAAVSNVKE
ncbi:MAG: hypothetical protein KDB84_05710 [Flavobacteriales bacterium]|nr:hypothetical protein [Flavobacteriales bacterium]